MTRQAFIRQAEMKRMAAVAVEYGVCVEAEIDGMTLRIMPSGTHKVVKRKLTREEQSEAALTKWVENQASQRDRVPAGDQKNERP